MLCLCLHDDKVYTDIFFHLLPVSTPTSPLGSHHSSRRTSAKIIFPPRQPTLPTFYSRSTLLTCTHAYPPELLFVLRLASATCTQTPTHVTSKLLVSLILPLRFTYCVPFTHQQFTDPRLPVSLDCPSISVCLLLWLDLCK